MKQGARDGTRSRLLEAAASMVAANPGGEISMRAICDQVGVKMPTLYHFFGNKQGLIEAVIERGFDLYLDEKSAHESSGDPIQDLREGWDAHVTFGIENPGFYTLMYGNVTSGYSPDCQDRPFRILQSITAHAEEQGRLVVPADQAARHVLSTNVGVTLHQIISSAPDWELSAAVREGVLAAISGTGPGGPGDGPAVEARRLMEFAVARPDILGREETRLLVKWLQKIRSHPFADESSAEGPR